MFLPNSENNNSLLDSVWSNFSTFPHSTKLLCLVKRYKTIEKLKERLILLFALNLISLILSWKIIYRALICLDSRISVHNEDQLGQWLQQRQLISKRSTISNSIVSERIHIAFLWAPSSEIHTSRFPTAGSLLRKPLGSYRGNIFSFQNRHGLVYRNKPIARVE